MRVTFFDILFLLAMIGGAAWGFYRGLFRAAMSTVVLYISTVVAVVGYRSMSRMIQRFTGQSVGAADVLAFLILLAILYLLLSLVGRDLIGHIDINRMGVWVNLGGMVFGFVNAAILCAIVLMIIRGATGGEKWIGYHGVQTFFRAQTHNSWMAFIFSPFMRFLLAIIQPWLFGHALPPLLVDAL